MQHQHQPEQRSSRVSQLRTLLPLTPFPLLTPHPFPPLLSSHQVPSEYLNTLITRSSGSVTIENALGDHPRSDPEVLAAAAAFMAIDHDANGIAEPRSTLTTHRPHHSPPLTSHPTHSPLTTLSAPTILHLHTGMLSLDEFEQLLVGTTMASSSADDRVARGRMQRMFGKADLNKDGRVDFNEVSCATTQAAQTANRGSYSKRLLPSPPLSLSSFALQFILMRKKTERHLRKEEERKMRHQAKHQERRGSNKGGGGGGGNSSKASPSRRSSRSGRASKDSSDGGSYRGPEVGMWVEAVRAEQQKGEVRSSSNSNSSSISLTLPLTLPSHHPFLPPSPHTGALCGGGQGARGDDREKVRATLEWRSSGLPL